MDLIKFIQNLGVEVVSSDEYMAWPCPDKFIIFFDKNERCVSSLLHELSHLFIWLMFGDRLGPNSKLEEDLAWKWAWAFCMELGLNTLDTFENFESNVAEQIKEDIKLIKKIQELRK